MTYHTNVIVPLVVLSSILLGCGSTPPAPSLSEAELEAQREYTTKLQQKDRDRNHIDRMRKADAMAHANKNGAAYYYSPYYHRSSELSDITVR
jgi:outer membrane PBP1 activator LpoA protein